MTGNRGTVPRLLGVLRHLPLPRPYSRIKTERHISYFVSRNAINAPLILVGSYRSRACAINEVPDARPSGIVGPLHRALHGFHRRSGERTERHNHSGYAGTRIHSRSERTGSTGAGCKLSPAQGRSTDLQRKRSDPVLPQFICRVYLALLRR